VYVRPSQENSNVRVRLLIFLHKCVMFLQKRNSKAEGRRGDRLSSGELLSTGGRSYLPETAVPAKRESQLSLGMLAAHIDSQDHTPVGVGRDLWRSERLPRARRKHLDLRETRKANCLVSEESVQHLLPFRAVKLLGSKTLLNRHSG